MKVTRKDSEPSLSVAELVSWAISKMKGENGDYKLVTGYRADSYSTGFIRERFERDSINIVEEVQLSFQPFQCIPVDDSNRAKIMDLLGRVGEREQIG